MQKDFWQSQSHVVTLQNITFAMSGKRHLLSWHSRNISFGVARRKNSSMYKTEFRNQCVQLKVKSDKRSTSFINPSVLQNETETKLTFPDECPMLPTSHSLKNTYFPKGHTIEFSLNGRVIQWIQRIKGIWQITDAWIWFNLKILSVTRVFIGLWYHLGPLCKRLCVQDSLFLQKYLTNSVDSTDFILGKTRL